MPEKKGFFTVYKRGQGLWSRISLVAVLGIFLIWLLVSLDGSFSSEVTLMEGTLTLLDSEKGTLSLNDEHLDRLLEHGKYGQPNVLVRIREKGDETPLKKINPQSIRDLNELRADIKEGKQVFLSDNVVVPRPVTADEISAFKKYKTRDEKISVVIAEEGGETVLRNWPALEKDLNDGKRICLKGEVVRRTWWYGRLFTMPVVDVDINNGHIIIIILFVLGSLGIFRMVNKTRNADFLIETESELKKVDWSSKEEIFGSTKVVILVTVIFLLYTFVLDTAYLTVLRMIKRMFFGE